MAERQSRPRRGTARGLAAFVIGVSVAVIAFIAADLLSFYPTTAPPPAIEAAIPEPPAPSPATEERRARIEALTEEVERLRAERAELRGALEAAEAAAAPPEDGEAPSAAEAAADRLALDALKRETTELQNELVGAREEVRTLRSSLEAARSDAEAASAEVARLRTENRSLNREFAAATDDLEALREENRALLSELETATDELEALRGENRGLAREVEAASDDLVALRDENRALSRELEAVVEETARLREENRALAQALEQARRAGEREEPPSIPPDLRLAPLDDAGGANGAEANGGGNGDAGNGAGAGGSGGDGGSEADAASGGDGGTAARIEGATVADGVAAYRAEDYERAAAIWRPLAEAGVAKAQFHIGAMVLEGRLGPPDRVGAYVWLSRAVANGYAPARPLLEEVEAALTPAERRAAEARLP